MRIALFAYVLLNAALALESHSWHRTFRPLSSDAHIPLSIGLKQQNLDSLEHFLMQVSTPHSSLYGKHWSAHDVADTFAASNATIQQVTNWLLDAGYAEEDIRLRRGGNWIDVSTTLASLESLLQTKYHEYRSVSGQRAIACEQYALPRHIQEAIDIILPSTHLDQPHSHHQSPYKHLDLKSHRSLQMQTKIKRSLLPKTAQAYAARLGKPQDNPNLPKVAPEGFVEALMQAEDRQQQMAPNAESSQASNILASCSDYITPACLRALYNFGDYKQTALSKNSYGIVEYTPQAFIQSDLDLFFGNFTPRIKHRTPRTFLIDDAVVQQTQQGSNYNAESDLDLEYAMALVDPLPVTLYQVGDLVQGASFNNFLDALDGRYCEYDGGDDPSQDAHYPRKKACGVVRPTNVISVSYGYDEAALSPAYERRQCQEYAKLGLMGVTILFSSGDYGVAGNSGICLNDNGRPSKNGARFNPSFPSSCPFVTSVGATQIKKEVSVLNPDAESACETVIYSGGGFSQNFLAPSYQKEALSKYFQSHRPTFSAQQFNNSEQTRGFPDLSANGANYYTVVNGKAGLLYGTSASAPVIGSILSLVNDARIAAKKSPIGFINPAIYSAAFRNAFHDITSGSNQGCGTGGFQAVPGWDPVTGLGTVNFEELRKAWMKLP